MWRPLVHTIGRLGPGIAVIVQIGHQTLVNDLLAQGWIVDRPRQFHPPHHVAVHPVGTGKVQVFLLSHPEIEHPGVFKKTANDGSHADVVGQARNLGRQHAGPPAQ